MRSCVIFLALLLQTRWATASPTIPFFASSASLAVHDTHWSSVVAMFHLDGSNGATSTTDTSSVAQAAAFTGTAALSTAQAKFGGSSLYVSGADSSAGLGMTGLTFGASDFCVEFWYYLPSFGTAAFIPIFTNYNWYNGTTAAGISLATDPTGAIYVSVFSGGGANTSAAPTTSSSMTASSSLQTGQWTHLALTREGATIRFFVNGQLKSSSTLTSNTALNSEGNTYYFGRWYSFAGGAPANTRYGIGYFDDIRITKGTARYTSTFTAPTLVLPDK